MRLALLSDAHCNSVGLVACLRHIERMDVDAIYFLGDAVGYLSDPARVLGELQRVGAHCQKGNHEAMLLGDLPLDAGRDAFYRLALQRDALGESSRDHLAQWPLLRELEIDGARLLLSHGSPAPSITERIHQDTPWEPGPDFAYDVVFIGHTHRPFARRHNNVQLVNVGSCGMPRDRGDLASFVIYDGATREPHIYRVPFSLDEVLQLHGAGVPAEVRALFERRDAFNGEVLR